MPKYRMDVYCRRGGVSMDAGTHMEREFETDKEFFAQVDRERRWLGKFYDEVYVYLYRDGEKIK